MKPKNEDKDILAAYFPRVKWIDYPPKESFKVDLEPSAESDCGEDLAGDEGKK